MQKSNILGEHAVKIFIAVLLIINSTHVIVMNVTVELIRRRYRCKCFLANWYGYITDLRSE